MVVSKVLRRASASTSFVNRVMSSPVGLAVFAGALGLVTVLLAVAESAFAVVFLVTVFLEAGFFAGVSLDFGMAGEAFPYLISAQRAQRYLSSLS